MAENNKDKAAAAGDASGDATSDATEKEKPATAAERRSLQDEAMEREAAAARTNTGETSRQMQRRNVGPTGLPLLWVASNRRDNRVVLWVQDPAHPGGEAFIGGSAPDLVARTGDIERVLMAGEAVEVPEPRRFELDPESGKPLKDESGKLVPNRKFPVAAAPDDVDREAASPGHATPLGREFDPALYDDDMLEKQGTLKRQQQLPRELSAPSGGIVPGVTHPIS